MHIHISAAQITISEVMFNPSGSETTDEFIELYNYSNNTVSIQDWLLVVDSDSLLISIQPDSTESPERWLLAPGGFVVIHDSPYWSGSNFYESIIPVTAKRFSATYSLTNSTGKVLQLLDSNKVVVSSYAYSPGNNNGYSDEKILLSEENIESNWGESLTEHGTPGSKNSISPLDFDLAIREKPLNFPEKSRPNEPIAIQITIYNEGIQLSGNATIRFGIDINGDSLLSQDEVTDNHILSTINPGDSLHISFQFQQPTGSYSLISDINYTSDEDTANNTFNWILHIGYPYMALLLNEIMYDPFDGDPEWVEIYNPSDTSIALSNWIFGDASSSSVILPDISLPSKGYLVLSSAANLGPYMYAVDSVTVASSFPTLNNSTDGLYLRDLSGFTVDTVQYFSTWGGNDGVSLERINPKISGNLEYNWAISKNINGATPTSLNTVIAPVYDGAVTNIHTAHTNSSEILFSGVIKNLGQAELLDGYLRLYQDINENMIGEPNEEVYAELIQNIPLADSVDFHHLLPNINSGYHQFILEYMHNNDTKSANNQLECILLQSYPEKSLVVTEIMYRPESGEPEWIELYVITDSLDVRGLQIHDAGHSCKIELPQRIMFYGGEYIIVAQDSSVIQSYNQLQGHLIVLKDLPALNNGSDSVRVMNFDGSVIEELYYSADWGGDYGVSLERKNVYSLSNLESNWGTSIADIGSSPGRLNSIASNIEKNLQIVRIDSNYSGYPNQPITVAYQIYNISENDFDDVVYQYGIDTNSDKALEHTEINGSGSIDRLHSGDSTSITFTTQFPLVEGPNALLISFSDSVFNEMFETYVWIPYKFQSLLFNELYADPSQIIEHEFLELVNISQRTVDLTGWQITVNSRPIDIPTGLICIPGGYIIIASDSSEVFPPSAMVQENWKSLPNSGASLQLIDQFGNIVDSLSYNETWDMEPGRSLERLHLAPAEHSALNWKNSHSPNGATPGSENSLYISRGVDENMWSFSNKVFSPDGDGHNDILQIAYQGEEALEYTTIKIYNTEGKLIRTIASDEMAPTPALWVWEGDSETETMCRIGMYIVLIEYETVLRKTGKLHEVLILAQRL